MESLKSNSVEQIGHMDKGSGKHQSNVVFGVNGVCPTLSACDYKEPIKVLVEDDMAEREYLIGSVYVGKSDKFQTGMSVDRNVSKTLMTHGECAIVLGYVENGTGQHQSNTVYSTDGVSPAITTITGGGTQQIKVLVEDE